MTHVRRFRWGALGIAVIGALAILGLSGPAANGGGKGTSFPMIRTAGLPAGCVPNATAQVHVVSNGPTETMTVNVRGLPANTDFDFFVVQQPGAPFGLSWYQGDIETNHRGFGSGTFIGRFSVETFIVAPGSVPAPTPHGTLDADSNPATRPVHTFHLGLWFNSPDDAAAAHCPDVVTPFNGEHNAGPQVLNTHNFGNLDGPLDRIH